MPQIPAPAETPVERLNINTFRVPGAAEGQLDNVAVIEGTSGWPKKVEQCVATLDEVDADVTKIEVDDDADDDEFSKF